MPFGRLNNEQSRMLASIVGGRRVLDVGCGHGTLSRTLLELGAAQVHGIDCAKSVGRSVPVRSRQLTFDRVEFFDYVPKSKPAQVAFLSWPSNYHALGLVELLRAHRTVVYLGSNLDCTGCGSRELQQSLLSRAVAGVVADEYNSLIVYGRPLPAMRTEPACLEERGMIDSWDLFKPYHTWP